MKRRCAVWDLGLLDYREAWELQRKLVAQRLEGSRPDTLLLLEHPAVYTVGRRGNEANVRHLGLPVFEVERGGEATYHGPGQLVGYPIVSLPRGKLEIKAYIRDLEEVLIRTVAEFGIPGERGVHAGLWLGSRKLASIGVAVKHHVTYHGFALNVNNDLWPFHHIRPCGLDGSALTSMKEVIGGEVSVEAVKRVLLPHFSAVLNRSLDPTQAVAVSSVAS